MRAIILYERAVAVERTWYIGRYIEAFKRCGVKAQLVCTDELPEYLSSETPDICVVRVIDPSLSRSLEERGIRVANSSVVSQIANDKLAAYEFVGSKTPVPFPGVYSSIDSIEFPVVAKKRDGHGGTEVFFIESSGELEKMIPPEERDSYVYQKPCSCPGRDVRVYVVGSRVVAAMERRNTSMADMDVPYGERFKSNYCLGGTATRYDIEADEVMSRYVGQILDVLPMDHAGIDFIFDNDEPVFNEIEDVVGSRMLYTHTDIDIVDLYVKHLVFGSN